MSISSGQRRQNQAKKKTRRRSRKQRRNWRLRRLPHNLVILSAVRTSRSEVLTKSKDPYAYDVAAIASGNSPRAFHGTGRMPDATEGRQELQGSFDSAKRFASESFSCAQDDKRMNGALLNA